MRLSRINIGKKMALVLGAGVLQLVCVGGVAIWGVHSIENAVGEAQLQDQKQVSTQQIMNDVSRLFVGVGNFALGAQQGAAAQDGVLALRREYRGIITDLLNQAESDEERRLMGQVDRATAPWREADDQVMKLAQAGKRTEASEVYRERAVPCFEGVVSAVGDVLQWRKKRVEEINQFRNLLIARMSLMILLAGLLFLAGTAMFTTLI